MKGQLLFWKVYVTLLAIFSVSLCLLSGACKYKSVSNSDQMRADVDKLVAAAIGRDKLWPWEPPLPEVSKVAAHGKAVAPMLLELLCDNPDYDNNCDWNVQQQVALALCDIYGVDDVKGHVYMNRAMPEDNAKVKEFWTEIVARDFKEKEKNKP